jgi:hypothetical protein
MTRFLSDLAAYRIEVPSVVRLSSVKPFAQMYRADERVVLGWFFPSRPSMVMPQVDLSAASTLGAAVLDAFDAEWSSLSEPDLDPYTTN